MYKIPISKSEQLTRSSSRNGFRYDYFFVLIRYVLSYQKRKQSPKGGCFSFLFTAEGFVISLGYGIDEHSSLGKRGERRRWRMKRPERSAAVGGMGECGICGRFAHPLWLAEWLQRDSLVDCR